MKLRFPLPVDSEMGGWINNLLDSNDLGLARLALPANMILGPVLLFGCIAFFVGRKWAASQVKIGGAPEKEEEAASREPGEWIPQSFDYPEFEASPFTLSEIKPPMYRPFRWGEYHVTMGIRRMQWEEWIELDDQFDAYYLIRKDRVRRKSDQAVRVLSPSVREHDGEDGPVQIGSGAPAAIELVHELADFLSRRYPANFQITRHASVLPGYPAGWGGAPPAKSIRVVSQKEEFELPLPLRLDFVPNAEKSDLEEQGVVAMKICGLLVQDDLAIMVEGSNGGYYFQAGAIIVPGFWRMQDKIGMRLDEIHLSGNVPQYREKLHTSFERFFRRLPIEKPVARNNYFIQVSPLPSTGPPLDPDELAWGETVLGPEDEYGGTKGSSHGDRPAMVVTPQTLRLRTERQTLRRLPRSGAVIFTIRTYLFPVEELVREPGVAARFASAVRSWPESVREYKGERRYGDILVRYLDEMAEKEKTDAEVPKKPYPY